jgi:glutamate/tyrosine decarboxylase-like PLP-dependent enzyme
MLAVKAARDLARETRPEITRPAMLLPESAHACFHKAAHYLGVEIVPVALDPATFRADAADARAKIESNPNVILVVGSAPSYAHGVIDPIEELAAVAQARGALMHVDACVGGFVLPFMRDDGRPVPAFDFEVPGVTSISMDVHKYGFAPKGVSVLVMRDRRLRDAQYYACAKWTGYTIVNSTTLGSKSVAAIGAAFAVMQSLGRGGYRAHARAMWSATETLIAAVRSTPGLVMLGAPDMNLFAFTTGEGDVFELADRLSALGWHVQPTYAFGRSPAHIHLTVDPGNAARAEAFAADLRDAARGLPPKEVPAPEVLAMLDAIAGGGEGIEISTIMRELGIEGGQLPERAGMIHRLLDAASPETRERMLVMFFGELFS